MNRRFIVTPDKHFPDHDKKAIKTLCRAIELIKPDGYIDLGDTGDWNAYSAWKWKRTGKPRLEYYLPEIITEVDIVNKGMDQIDESLDKANVKEKHFCQGNHELWMDYFVEEYPYLPQYGTVSALKMKERGYTYHEAGKLLEIEDMNFYHGHNYGGMHHASNHCKQYKANIMYGHFHDIQVWTDKSKDGPITAYSIGCLKDMSHEKNLFCKGRPINWKHAFAVIDFINGKSHVNVVEIREGVAVWGSKII
tara:strand:- start:1578 stop:2327 length:750 start_codon:yes stop_codon:yes gene_type:complete